MPVKQKTMPNAKRVQAKRWRVKKHGLQPGDRLPSKKDRRKKHPPLSKEQQKLVEEHRWIAGRLAHSAKCLTGGHTGCFTREDLESVAYFALCVAASRYDPSLGWKFSTYAWNTARGYIQHSLRDFSRMVRVPRWVGGVRDDVRELGKQGLTYEEIAEELGMEESQVLMCEESWKEIHSSYDYTPDDSRPREFTYEIDEVKTMIGVEVFHEVGDLSDADIELLLLHVEGELETDEDKNRAESMLQRLRDAIGVDYSG
jgi:DNA-directed RNA polymerase specialized sigma subunit